MPQAQAGFGVIGAGLWGETHLRAYGATPGARLVAMYDLDGDLAQRRAQQWGAASWTTDYQQLLARPDLAAVSVATPDFAHYEIGLAAVQAGKHVLLEKPMALDSGQAQEMADAAQAAGVVLMVDFHNRWNPAFVETRRAVQAGELGEVEMISIRLNDTLYVPTEMLRWAQRSSVLWFLGAHTADTACWLAGQGVRRVYAVKRSRVLKGLGVDTPDFFQSLLELEGGAVVHMENCWILSNSQPNLFDMKLELVGSQGTVYADLATHRMMEKYTAQGATYPDMTVARETYSSGAAGFGIESIQHFARCVLHGDAPLVSPQDGVANVRLLEAIERAANTGRPIEPDWPGQSCEEET